MTGLFTSLTCRERVNDTFILLSSSSSTTYVMEEDEPSFLEAIDYSAESGDEDGEPETEHVTELPENPDHPEQLSDSETNHRE